MPTLNGGRGAFLLSFGLIYVAIGLNYATSPQGSAVRHAMSWMPDLTSIEVCGAAWAAAGLVAVVSAFLKMPHDRFGFMALAAWATAWAFAWIGATVWQTVPPRDGLAGALVFALLTVSPMAVSRLPNPVAKTTVRSTPHASVDPSIGGRRVSGRFGARWADDPRRDRQGGEDSSG